LQARGEKTGRFQGKMPAQNFCFLQGAGALYRKALAVTLVVTQKQAATLPVIFDAFARKQNE
jgi:hypothetical protein